MLTLNELSFKEAAKAAYKFNIHARDNFKTVDSFTNWIISQANMVFQDTTLIQWGVFGIVVHRLIDRNDKVLVEATIDAEILNKLLLDDY